MKLLKTLSLCGLLAFAMASCSNKTTELQYFVDVPSQVTEVVAQPAPNPELRPGDELYITVSSPLPSAVAMFNMPYNNSATSNAVAGNITGRENMLTYIINSEGNIQMPVLGTVHVAGLTVEQLQKELTKMVSRQVQDATVRVQLVNFRINVLGEVNRPGSVGTTRTRFSLLDALAAAGDLTEYGERDNVLLIREQPDGTQLRVRLDLNDAATLTSPYFYLMPNDVIYVTPNSIRTDNAKYNTNNAFKISVVSTVVSTISVIASLVIALAVK